MQLISRISTRGASRSVVLVSVVLLLPACAKHDAPPPAQDSATATTSSAPPAAPAAATVAGPADITPIRGTLSSVSDSAITVTTANGDVRVIVQQPLHVFSRVKSKLSAVTPSTFVGVTSVKQPDGSERATEIHIFPEELRGTGEGSYPMTQTGADTSHTKSTMTNGTVSGQGKGGTPPRMTNGTIASQGTGTLVVQYKGGTQTITIPSDVSVSAIAPVSTKLTKGAKVVVLGKKQADGTMTASSLVVADSAGRSK
jgi:hypothetical protein